MTEKNLNRLGNEIIFLKNDFEKIVLKSIPGKKIKTFVKHSKEEPHEIEPTTDLVFTTLLEWDEINKEEYDKF